MRDETKRFDLLGKGVKAYSQKTFNLYNRMQIFGQPKPKPLIDIYINLNILEKITHLQSFTADELNENIGISNRPFWENSIYKVW